MSKSKRKKSERFRNISKLKGEIYSSVSFALDLSQNVYLQYICRFVVEIVILSPIDKLPVWFWSDSFPRNGFMCISLDVTQMHFYRQCYYVALQSWQKLIQDVTPFTSSSVLRKCTLHQFLQQHNLKYFQTNTVPHNLVQNCTLNFALTHIFLQSMGNPPIKAQHLPINSTRTPVR